MAYDLIAAEKSNADIITMAPDLIRKTKKFGSLNGRIFENAAKIAEGGSIQKQAK